jgi:membrane-associated protein
MTIVITRFVPILRTFAPFVAGIARMTYLRFFAYNLAGALAWVLSLLYAGYWFGNVPVVKQNLSLVIIGVIVLSVMPIVIEYCRYLLNRAKT